MDEYYGKRHIGGVVVSRKSSSLVSSDMTEHGKQDAQFCNRIGCSGRLKYRKATPVGLTEKPKSSRLRSSNGKEIIGCSSSANTRKSFRGSKSKVSSHLDTDSSESSSTHGDADVPQIITSTRNQSGTRQGSSGKVSLPEIGSPRAVSDSKSVRVFRRKHGTGCQNVQPAPAVSSSSTSSSSGASSSNRGSRYGLKNLKCNSISDIVPQEGSSSESKVKRDVKKRSPEGEGSSSSRGKRSSSITSHEGRLPLSTSGISISCPRPMRNWVSNDESNNASSRTRRSLNANTRMASSYRIDLSVPSLTESAATIPELSQLDTQLDTSVNSLSNQSNDLSSYSTSSSNSDNSPSTMPLTSIQHGVTHALRRYNLDGVAEMLMALERIEQDEELSYEQLLALETNLFLGSLHLHDQHRDERLDIDNMSYEELLALEERMGTVSTALSEEALTKCLTMSIFQNTSLEFGVNECGNDEDEIKCSICQEEYEVGDEIGKLACKHGYHSVCIQQWLRLKNWCPICKASAASPSLSSS